MKVDTRSRGDEAESIAARYLENAGLRILQRNYRCRFGEIDLIAQDGSTLVFVEVRQRSHTGFGGAAASITPAKQRKLMAAARHYLAGIRRTPDCWFDAVLLSSDTQTPEWLRNIMAE
jgi:putative endonuclease